MKRFLLVLICGLMSLALCAEEKSGKEVQVGLALDLTGKLSTETRLLSTREAIHFGVQSEFVDIASGLSLNNDGRFSPDIAGFRNSQSFGDNYFLIEEGYVRLKGLGAQFSIGRINPKDEVDSPYSLFINSPNSLLTNTEALASNSMILRWDTDIFSYESRWIELNNRSNFSSVAATPPIWQWVWDPATAAYIQKGQSFPDRGVNVKNFIFKFGNMRLGLQDAAVYTQRNFDFEYFISPIPMYFTQYVKTTFGRPWTTSGNENNMFGFFWDLKEADYSLYVQYLLDDFNLYFLDPNTFPNNPWKQAWSLGGTLKTEVGTFGFYHAGAVKYTFEPITTSQGTEAESAYGYSYFPDSVYYVGGVEAPFNVQDYSVGYRNGENNIAFLFSWANLFVGKLSLASSLEFVLSGNSSPSNPWHDATASNEVGTRLLDDPVLEKRLLLNVRASFPVENWDFFAKLTFGGIFNKMVLQDPEGRPATFAGSGWTSLDYYGKIFKPGSDSHLVFSLQLGIRLNLDIGKAIRSANSPAPGSTALPAVP